MRKTAHLGFVLTVLAFGTLPAHAQTTPQASACATQAIASDNAVEKINALGRAKNLARQAAEATNGGLGKYRADVSMHGAVSDAPCVDNGNGTWTFTVKGGKPGFTTPTQETVVTVDGSSWQVTVDYNGAVR
ncbi:MAG: hypothetical protein HC866_10965 [Leptolyngbyaceae cyanobacterium RU_5_1]|nr:hypothetical protein [Leptolyngbyaceae cyanobacterium RU_5_1]